MNRLSAWLRGRVAMMSSEDGFAMIIVIVMLMIVLALGAAGLAESLDSKTLTTRDARERRAQQATDAGIQRVLYEESESNIDNWNLNGGVLGLSTVADCMVPSLNASLQISGLTAVVSNAGVCPLTSAGGTSSYVEPLGNHTFESTEFIPGATNLLNGTTISSQNGSAQRQFSPKIVALGWDDNGTNKVYSRQEVILAPIAPLQAIEGQNSVTIGGLQLCLVICTSIASTLNGDVTSRGNLTTPATLLGLNLSSGLIATLAYSGTLSGGLAVANAQKVSSSSLIQRPAVLINSSKPDCSVSSYCTGLAGSNLGTAYNSTYNTFSMSSGTATFNSGDYVFCSFNATGGTVKIVPASSAPVRIFIDSPNSARCAADKLHGDANLGNFNDTVGYTDSVLGTGGVVDPSGMQVYVVGDGAYDSATKVQLGPTSTSGLLSTSNSALTDYGVIYAPTSKVTVNVPGLCTLGLLCSGGVFSGAVIGNDTTVNALTITQDLDLGNYPLYDGISVFRPIQYIQCNSTLTSLSGNSTTDTTGC
jgi:Tfp pilus assembly protein PilX